MPPVDVATGCGHVDLAAELVEGDESAAGKSTVCEVEHVVEVAAKALVVVANGSNRSRRTPRTRPPSTTTLSPAPLSNASTGALHELGEASAWSAHSDPRRAPAGYHRAGRNHDRAKTRGVRPRRERS